MWRQVTYKNDAVIDGQSHEDPDQIVFAKICWVAFIWGHGEPVAPANVNLKFLKLIIGFYENIFKVWKEMKQEHCKNRTWSLLKDFICSTEYSSKKSLN